jgi:hypothetical protein
MSRAGDYDIVTDQGSSFTLHLAYQDDDGNPQSLSAYTSRMQVRRSPTDQDLLLWITGSTVDPASGDAYSTAITGGGSTGEFSGPTGGVTGSGYLKIEVSSSGATGFTGGLLINVGADTMAEVPHGKHWYDLEIVSGTTVHKLIKGRFEVEPEITR